MSSSVDWNTDTTSGLVPIGNYSLFLRAAGQVRSPGAPAVICIPGLGDSSVTWTAVMRHVSAFARVYGYDRTGLGKSGLPADFTPKYKTYVNMAQELRLLLEIARVAPPYILVMHSMGGIPGREFLHLFPEDVAGLVFLDTKTEESYKARPENLHECMVAMWEGVDMSFLWSERKAAMTDEEWKEVNNEEDLGTETTEQGRERQNKAISAEVENYPSSSDILGEKKQLDRIVMGDRPVSVVKGDEPGEMRRCFEKAKAEGKGTEEQKEMIASYLNSADEKQLMLQFKQLRLSRNSRLVEARHSWHNVQMYEPELVAREVRWCLDEYEKLEKPAKEVSQ